MDREQIHNEFLSILSESHPGLTFEEYRDSCVFLLFYQYLCLKHDDLLEDVYKPGELVKMAIRGKLQVASFLKFMESASSFLHMLNKEFQLTAFSFYKKLQKSERKNEWIIPGRNQYKEKLFGSKSLMY